MPQYQITLADDVVRRVLVGDRRARTLQVPWTTKGLSDAEISQSAVSALCHSLLKGLCNSAPPMATFVASLAAGSSAKRARQETVSGLGRSFQPGPSAVFSHLSRRQPLRLGSHLAVWLYTAPGQLLGTRHPPSCRATGSLRSRNSRLPKLGWPPGRAAFGRLV